MEPAVCLRAWLAFFILRTLKLGGTILSHKVDLQRCMSSKRNTTPDFRLHVTPIIAQYNVEMRKCGMRNAESKMRNVRAEWCVECGKLVIKAFSIAYYLLLLAALFFLNDI